MAYQSSSNYGGRLACVGDDVIIVTSEGVCAGKVNQVFINNEVDDLHILKLKEAAISNQFTFVETANPGQIEALSEGQWTWPL